MLTMHRPGRVSVAVAVAAVAVMLILGAVGVHSAVAGTDATFTGEGTPFFTEVTAAVGITSTHSGLSIPGQAWGDVNNDGDLDLFLTGGNLPNTLYENQGDGTFAVSPMGAQAVLSGTYSAGAAFGDYDNDTWLDLSVMNIGPNRLFRNEGGVSFANMTGVAGVGDNGNGETGSWGDYDGDGYLDLYVTNWWCQHPDCTNYSRDGLFHNNGDGTFTNVVTSTLPYTETDKPTFVASFLDYDNDKDLDLYVVVDKHYGNTLYRNDGPGCGHWCFTDVSAAAGANIEVDGMGLGVSDYDLDGDLDLYFSNAGPPVLLQNQTSQGSPTFLDVTDAAGVGFNAISWAAVFFDYDNDGCPDAYLAVMNTTPGLENRLYRNNCDGTFTDVSAGSGVDNNGESFGVAYGDYDADGWLDLVVGNIAERHYLYRNIMASTEAGTNGWLHVELEGGGPINRDAIGSRVYLELSDGRTLMQELKSGSSLGSGNEIALHFGLGSATITEATVRWSDGLEETFPGPEPNQTWRVAYPVPTDATLSAFDGDAAATAPIALLSVLVFLAATFAAFLGRRLRLAGKQAD